MQKEHQGGEEYAHASRDPVPRSSKLVRKQQPHRAGSRSQNRLRSEKDNIPGSQLRSHFGLKQSLMSFRIGSWPAAALDYTNMVSDHGSPGSMPRKTPDESLLEALGWLLERLLDLGRIAEGGVKSSCSGFGAVLDDERKVAGKRNYFTAVVVVVMAKVSIWAAAGLPDRRRE